MCITTINREEIEGKVYVIISDLNRSTVDIYHIDKSLVLTEDEDFKFDYIAEHYGHRESECTYMISDTLTINLHK